MKPNIVSPLLIVLLLFVSACSRRDPSGILSKGKMEEVLYEYQLARAVAMQSSDSVDFLRHEYTEAVLKKYHITRAEFDSSLVWYSQHTGSLYTIYQNIGKRLEKESRLLGVQTNEASRFSRLSDKGDTANVWNGRSFYCLTVNGANNLMSFNIKADTTYHAQDRLMWHFVSHFVYRSGRRDAVVNLSVCYDNDSIGSVTQHLNSDGDYSLSMDLANRKIKRVYGFIYHNGLWEKDEKILVIAGPSLIRFHKAKEKAVAPQDSTSAPGAEKKPVPYNPDSMNRQPVETHAKPVPMMKDKRHAIPFQ